MNPVTIPLYVLLSIRVFLIFYLRLRLFLFTRRMRYSTISTNATIASHS